MTKELLELAASINPKTIEKFRVGESVADRNEKLYGGVETEKDRWEKSHAGTYVEIMSGTDNGACATRQGTYRKIKTGDGRRGAV